jgi:hypothetical protein
MTPGSYLVKLPGVIIDVYFFNRLLYILAFLTFKINTKIQKN